MGCGVRFRGRKNKLYCSSKCGTLHGDYDNGFSFSKYPGLSTGTIGAIGELMVSADLLMKGYEVFRSVSATCSCDLAILKNGKFLRIEVRSGYKIKSGELRYLGKVRADHVAIVFKNEIEYSPKLPD